MPGSAPHLIPRLAWGERQALPLCSHPASPGENARLRPSPHSTPRLWRTCSAPHLIPRLACGERQAPPLCSQPASPGENARLRPSPHSTPRLWRTPGSAPPLTARLATPTPQSQSLHCPFRTVGCLWAGPSAAPSVAEQDPLLGNRLRIMTTATAALLRAALTALCCSAAPEPSPRPRTSQPQA